MGFQFLRSLCNITSTSNSTTTTTTTTTVITTTTSTITPSTVPLPRLSQQTGDTFSIALASCLPPYSC
ncbi:hypothetical protein E2C01_057192 [Portunus trituberculatus]|uniref:Uncharacterized protein n=1 Tax=Portunus trituberculatus TaxID=210409 RepID=A0A5B7H1N8_PORTR|nr:hypothetical protein [Portunus trituberculatus]